MKEELDIGIIDPGVVPYVWGDVLEIVNTYGRKWLEEVEIDKVLQQVVNGDYELWVATSGNQMDIVGFCWWERTGKRTYYHIAWMGGRALRKYLKVGLDKVEQYACMSGATEVRFAARLGWMRKLEMHGYGLKTRVLGKNVQVCWRN